MRKIIIYTVLITFFSCSKPHPKSFIKHLNGYWEIERVQLSNGTEKKYNYNQSVDFFEINDAIGIRKKVQPKLDGSFITTNDREVFTIKIENDSLRMYYKNSLSSRKETVVLAKENQIIIKNEAGNTYFYKPYQKITLE